MLALGGCRDGSRYASSTPARERLSESRERSDFPEVSPTAFISAKRLSELEGVRPEEPAADQAVVVWEFPAAYGAIEASITPQPLPDVEESAATPAGDSLDSANEVAAAGPLLLGPRQNGDLGPHDGSQSRVHGTDTPPVVQHDASPVGDAAVQESTPTAPQRTDRQGSAPSTSERLRVAATEGPLGRDETVVRRSGPSAEILALLAQSTPAATGAPTGDHVNSQAAQRLHRSNELAARGAYFAARKELIEVLKSIAAAKDAIHGSLRRGQSLTAGLRSLEEAEDFALIVAGDSEYDEVAMAATAHETPLGKRGALTGLAPWQAADVYLRFAQLNLGAAVAGEPAGSMALHALGKLYSRLDKAERDRHSLAHRRAFACQQAALLARNDNYLAAHELGVLLAESGHYADAEFVLRQVAVTHADPVLLRNLAQVNRLLGRGEAAVHLEQHAVALAANRPSNNSVRVVTPAAFAAARDADAPSTAVATRASSNPVVPPVPANSPPQPTATTPWYLR